MKYFLSCDWGTSGFRLRLAEPGNSRILAEETSHHGIAATFAAWQKSGQPNENRTSFYLAVVKNHISKIEVKMGELLNGVPLIISGMASSSIGFIDIPYSPVPVNLDGRNIKTAFISATKEFSHEVLVISGIRTDDDVIRGEETQLIGCVDGLKRSIADELFIFPGTHSKHIRVVNNEMIGFKTYMTGEFFELLSKQSILSNSVESNDMEHLDSFKQGVNAAVNSNLLNAAFKVRTNNLFDKLSNKENFQYLSGLLIGTELKDLAAAKINLVCSSNLKEHYLCALQELGFADKVQTFDSHWVDVAVVRGHYKIYKQTIK